MRKVLLAIALFFGTMFASQSPIYANQPTQCYKYAYPAAWVVKCTAIDYSLPGTGEWQAWLYCYNTSGTAWVYVKGPWARIGYSSSAVCPSGY